MALIQGLYVDEKVLAGDVEAATKKLGPEVVRVRYDVGADSNDEAAIYFRIVLQDSAARRGVLGGVAGRIRDSIFESLDSYMARGWHIYCHFSSESEQDRRHDPDWA